MGILESYLHRKRLFSIPIRIHVNGTRGKSSVTRLIAAGLRAGGKKTCAKTTGTLPRMILPDGIEYPVFRKSRANILEQIRIIKNAASLQADVLVLECMALQPYLQSLSEFKLVRATHGVITNAREDHLDVMGPGERDVASALCGMVPENAVLYTTDGPHNDILAYAAGDRQTKLQSINEHDFAKITDDELKCFSYIEHKENIALALKVCQDIGIDREIALKGMQQAMPDPGATTAHRMVYFGREIIFINGFAANDPFSTEKLWKMVCVKYHDIPRKIALINCRADRADRSRQLGIACADWQQPDYYMLMGSGTHIFARTAAQKQIPFTRFIFVENQSENEIFEKTLEIAEMPTLVMGMGNIGDLGLNVVRYFRNRSTKEGLL